MRPVFVRWKCSGCGELNMVSVPSGYVWEKELACRTCHHLFTEASSPEYQIPVRLDSGARRRALSVSNPRQH
jgi:hypothetical protein